MSEENKLPKGWEKAKLDEIIIRMTNGANSTQFDEKVGFPISRIETIWNQTIDLSRVKYIKENDPEFVEKYKLRDNDILFSHINSDSHIGKTAIFKLGNSCTLIHGINLLLLRPSAEISALLLNYQFNYLRAKGSFAAVAQKAVNQSSINQAKLKQFDFLIPPIAEQHRIVAKIEELFSSLDKALESIKTAKEQLKVYRQAVLKYAFEGRFTNGNVKDGELPMGWNMTEISELITKLDQGWSPKCENEKSSNDAEWAVIKTTAIQHNFFLPNENKILPKTLKPRQQHELKDGDILITRAGPRIRVGVCCLVKNVRPKLLNCDKAYRIKPDEKKVIPAFLVSLLNTNTFLSIIDKCKSGGNDSGLNLTQNVFLSIKVPCPKSIDEQRKIISEIESRLSVCDKIEESIEVSLLQAEALRQSILKRAFEGKLVPQDPNDEPASKLIERIKAERAKSDGAKVKKEKKVKQAI